MRAMAQAVSLLLMAMLFTGAVQMAPVGWLGGLALLLMISLIAIIVHELGHAAMLWWLGGRVDQICVIGICYDVRLRRWTWGSMGGAQDMGGYVLGELDPVTATSRQDMLVAMAGPAANVALALILIALLPLGAMAAESGADLPVVIAGAPDMAAPARLPDAATLKAIMADAAAQNRAAYWSALGMATAHLLALASIGMAAINLIPFPGSDGDIIRKCRAAL